MSNTMGMGQMGGPSGPMQGSGNQMGGPGGQMGGPGNQMGGPANQMGGPGGQMGGPANQMGGSAGQIGGPGGQMGGSGGQMGGPGGQMGGHMNQEGQKQIPFSQTQLHQLRAQIMVYKLIARNQPVPENFRLAAEGKRPMQPQFNRPGMKEKYLMCYIFKHCFMEMSTIL